MNGLKSLHDRKKKWQSCNFLQLYKVSSIRKILNAHDFPLSEHYRISSKKFQVCPFLWPKMIWFLFSEDHPYLTESLTHLDTFFFSVGDFIDWEWFRTDWDQRLNDLWIVSSGSVKNGIREEGKRRNRE